jgi:hypothetical protein
MTRPELTNLFSVKLAGPSGIAIVPDAPLGTMLTPAMQLVILTGLLDFFVSSIEEGQQIQLESFLLDNFRKACELRHEQAIGHTFKA